MNLLFLCTGNACRSQMAEGWARRLAPAWLKVESAGIEAHGLNPRAIAVMREVDIDITSQASSRVTDAMLQRADLVVTVCGHADEHCPVLPLGTEKVHWPVADPARATGTDEEVMAVFRRIRDEVRAHVEELIKRLAMARETTLSQRNNDNLYCKFFDSPVASPDSILIETLGGEVYTYNDAENESSKIARHLTGLGLCSGDRVTAQVNKSPQALWLYLACLKAGMVFHPLNPAYTESELGYFISDAKPGLIVCDACFRESVERLAKELQVPHVETLNADGSGSLMDHSASNPDDFTPVHRESNDMAALLYSSGTTGHPKGIMLSHRNLYDNAATLADAWGFTKDDTLLHALPIFHVHGLFVAIGCVLASGARMRWLAQYNVADVLQSLPQCTVMMGVPTYYTRLLYNADFGRQPCDNMRLFISGSAPLLEETFAAFRERTGRTILERYGMSETGMNTSNPLQGERKAGTVGPPLPGVELRIVDDQDKPLPVNEIGHIQVRGSNVFQGYWRMPDKTAEDFTDDCFFRTGDQGRIDEDGYVSIVGRAKDMIISGGLNVYPKEVELVLDDIDGVRESAVVGVPHPDFGEAVVAAVVLEEGVELDEQFIVAFARDRLANFKVPKKVFFVDVLPRNTMAKVQKNVLSEQYQDCFHAG
ncbi:MAG: arsenate reductase (thioredoxin) [Pseudomonadales bacterium]